MYKKALCTCKVVFLPCQAIAFLLSRHRHILNLILFTICCDPSETEFSQCKLNCSCQDPLWLLLLLIASETVYDSSVVPSFQVRKAFERTRQLWRDKHSCTNSRKELWRCCSPIRHHNTKHFFCAQSASQPAFA